MLLAKADSGVVIFWCLVLIGVIGVLGAGVWYLRRRIFSTPETNMGDEWSLQHLRELRKRGEISEEEFGRLRAKMIGKYETGRSTRAESASERADEPGGSDEPS